MSRSRTWFQTQAEWCSIEGRLRKIGAPEASFNADFNAQVQAAIQRFEALQDQREAQGFAREPLPEDPRVLVLDELPLFARCVKHTLSQWRKSQLNQPKQDAKMKALRAERRAAKLSSMEPKEKDDSLRE